MPADLDFLIGLLDQNEPRVAQEDIEGEHASALRTWQEMGFLSSDPGMNPVPTCPHCDEGVPYQLSGRYVCHACRSVVDPRQLLLWQIDREAFLRWLAAKLNLRGGVRRIDERLWQLGTLAVEGVLHECFYRRQGVLSDAGKSRLTAYRTTLVFCGASLPPEGESGRGRCISLLELLWFDDSLSGTDLRPLLHPRENVRFDTNSGVLWVGNSAIGEVPVGSKEYFFLRCLARDLDHFVPYADIKHEVLRQTGSTDATEEATFCHNLKSRIKKKCIPPIDRLLATTNKADGYRLRGVSEA